MASAESLNWDQHSMKEGHARSLFHGDKDRQGIVIRALGGARMIGHKSSKHIKIYIEGDGLVTTASSGGGGRGAENFESQLRRAHRSVGMDFPRHGESTKAFQKRMERKQGNVDEQQ
jgi:hypothetical protein